MRTVNRSFQLEETFPGIFLLQGWLGSVIAAFVYVAAICIWEPYSTLVDALCLLPFMMFFTSILGIVKAVIIWAPYRLTKVQPRAVTRVAIASLATGLFALTTGYLLGPVTPQDMTAWTLTLLLGGLPTAVLIGSRVKPWELFTFGSIAGERPRTVLGTLATLPLRFLSLFTLALWILSLACEHKQWTLEVLPSLMVPAGYLLFSAYLTFRSPRQDILLAIGLIANLSMAAFLLFAYSHRLYTDFAPPVLLVFSVASVAFLVAWVIFLIARLNVRTHPHRVPELSAVLLRAHEVRDHDCLGSRFLEWQQRVA